MSPKKHYRQRGPFGGPSLTGELERAVHRGMTRYRRRFRVHWFYGMFVLGICTGICIGWALRSVAP